MVHGALELLMAGAVRAIIAEVPSQLLASTLTLTLDPDLGRNLNPNPNHYADCPSSNRPQAQTQTQASSPSPDPNPSQVSNELLRQHGCNALRLKRLLARLGFNLVRELRVTRAELLLVARLA